MLSKQPNNIFIKELLEKAPWLNELYEEHLKDFDELLPHVLMGSVTRYLIGLAENAECSSTSAERLDTVLDYFEHAMLTGDEAVKELLVVSFLENLEKEEAYYRILTERLGSRLSKALDIVQ